MRARVAWRSASLVLVLAGVADAQSPPPVATDPARRLAQSLSAQVKGVLEQRVVPARVLTVPPVADRTGRFGGGVQRLRSMLLLDLASVSTIRIQPTDERSAPPGVLQLTTALDATSEALVLTGLLSESGSERPPVSLLAALAASPDTIASLTHSSSDGARLRFVFLPAGSTKGPVLAVAAGRLRAVDSDDAALVTDSGTRVLAPEGTSFREIASMSHPRGEVPAMPSRDPRAGVAIVAKAEGASELWVRPPRDLAGYRWSVDGRVPAPLRRATDLPIGPWAAGGFVVATSLPGTNVLVRLGVSAGPFGPTRPLSVAATPALEAAVDGDWVATVALDGKVWVGSSRAGAAVALEAGRSGSALALLSRPRVGTFVLADRDDGNTLVVSRIQAADVEEVWRGPAPFPLCRLAVGDWDGNGDRDALAVGCGDAAALALLRIEEEL